MYVREKNLCKIIDNSFKKSKYYDIKKEKKIYKVYNKNILMYDTMTWGQRGEQSF